jgi:hypothetical protein
MALYRFLITSLPLSCIDGLLRMCRIVACSGGLWCFVGGSGTTMASNANALVKGCRKRPMAQSSGIFARAACGTPEREMRCSKCETGKYMNQKVLPGVRQSVVQSLHQVPRGRLFLGEVL